MFQQPTIILKRCADDREAIPRLPQSSVISPAVNTAALSQTHANTGDAVKTIRAEMTHQGFRRLVNEPTKGGRDMERSLFAYTMALAIKNVLTFLITN